MLDKLSKVFGKKNFRGQGHRLGSTDTEKHNDAARNRSDKSSARAGPNNKVDGADPRGSPAKAAFSGRPQRLGRGESAERPATAPSRPAEQGSQAGERAQEPTAGAALPPDGVFDSTVPASEAVPADFQLLDLELAQSVATEELQAALTQLASGPEGPRGVLKRLFANILRVPGDTKYRRVRLGNPKIQAAIVDADGGLEMLQACGFHVVMDDVEHGSPSEAFAVLPEDDELLQMNAALVLLGYQHPAPAEAPKASAASMPEEKSKPPLSTAAADPQAEPCERETQVILPSGPEGGGQVADWVFKRTPAELKTAMMEARRKREQSEMLMTRATREKLQAGQTPVYSKATVRVRLPEGLLLQGTFSARERVAAVFDWVTDCLADPGMTYELVTPDRKPLVTSMGTLRTANMVPNVLLILRSDTRGHESQNLTVKPELLRSGT